ncbi:hypothetical protein CLV94_1301 [Flavobacterium endophyticum]|uniref:Uncharacterized protein n=1 Tax=Flavobacterium endophyticum TaxID=1540163 RepID=A0A495MJU2_9FLAO|nr:hypothetical protein CLV94_1301 [Flavobacterium endophyticum]
MAYRARVFYEDSADYQYCCHCYDGIEFLIGMTWTLHGLSMEYPWSIYGVTMDEDFLYFSYCL